MTMRPYRGIDTRVSDAKVRLALQEIDMFLREATQALSANISDTPAEVDASAQFLVLAVHNGLAAERRAAVSAPIAATDGGANGTWTLSLNNAVPSITFAGTSAAGTDAAAALRTDAILIFPQALRSIAATAGDTLTLTSDGTDLTLTPSRAGADLIIRDQAANKRLHLYDSTASTPGGFVNGHWLIGQETHAFGTGPINDFALLISRRKSQSSGFHSALAGNPIYDADSAGSDEAGAQYTVTLDTGYDPNVAGGTVNNFRGEFIDIGGTVGGAALVGSVVTLSGLTVRISPTIPAGSPAWTNMIGIQIFNNSLNGVAPTRSYGIQVAGAGNGATAWAGMFGGDVQITASNKLRFGGLTVTQATDTMYRAAAGNLRWQIAGTDELDLNASALFPTANGGLGSGRNGNGWLDLWLKDTVAAFETRLIATSTGITADNTLTLDLGNASRIVTLTGNPTLADWFDQNVKTTGTPQFARLGIGEAADGTVLLNVNDSVAAPSTSALTGFTSKYGGDTVALGDPAAWLRIRVAGSTYKVPLFT